MIVDILYEIVAMLMVGALVLWVSHTVSYTLFNLLKYRQAEEKIKNG